MSTRAEQTAHRRSIGKLNLAPALALALMTAAGCTANEIAPAPGSAIRPLVVRQIGSTHHLTTECTGTARPDRVVIAGAMTADAAQPTEAQDRLDRQLAELRRFVESERGRIELLERVRAARATGDYPGNRPAPPPFLALQRLEAEFPSTVAVDAVFERVLELGLDRFGSNIRVDYVDRRRQVAVVYRFSALHGELDRIHARCRAETVAYWCANQGTGTAACALEAGGRDAHVKTRALSLRTQSLLNERGSTSSYHVSYPWRSEQLARIEPVGEIAVEFRGTLQLEIVDAPPLTAAEKGV